MVGVELIFNSRAIFKCLLNKLVLHLLGVGYLFCTAPVIKSAVLSEQSAATVRCSTHTGSR
jgi:hypothetical protein